MSGGRYIADDGISPPYHHQTRSAPLSDGFSSTVSLVASSIFTEETVKSVTTAVGTQTALKAQAEEGSYSLRMMALLGGILLIATGSLEFASNIMLLQIPGALIELYTLFVGLAIFIMENKGTFLSNRYQGSLFKYALFLKFLWGRGALYFVVGTIQLYHFDLLNFVAGIYMCFVGILMIRAGQRTAYKLKNTRRSLYSPTELQAKFARSW